MASIAVIMFEMIKSPGHPTSNSKADPARETDCINCMACETQCPTPHAGASTFPTGTSLFETSYFADCDFGADAVGGEAFVFLRESRTIATKAAKTITVAARNA